MAYNGANGSTKIQIAKILHVLDISTSDFNQLIEAAESSIARYGLEDRADVAEKITADVEYLSANSMWIDDGFVVYEEFAAICKQSFNAHIATAPLSEEKTLLFINEWVAQKTGKKIQDLLKLTDNLDALVLINALYFQGAWEHQFQTKLTRDERFSCGDGTTRLVPMMSWAQPTRVPYLKNELFESVALSYRGGGLSMFFLCPVEGQTLERVIDGLQSEQWSQWLSEYELRQGLVSLPRFKVEAEISMNETLKALGMVDAFGPADFSSISNSQLYISNVQQKTSLTVDEKGSEAAAATAIIMSRSLPQTDFNFVVDKPFLSILYDHDSGAILLITSVNSPEI